MYRLLTVFVCVFLLVWLEMDVESEVIKGRTRLGLTDCDHAGMPATVYPWDSETITQEIKRSLPLFLALWSGKHLKAIHTVTTLLRCNSNFFCVFLKQVEYCGWN